MIVGCVDIGGIVDHHCINMSNFASMFRRFAVLATKEPKRVKYKILTTSRQASG
jgi:hypothetical protein